MLFARGCNDVGGRVEDESSDAIVTVPQRVASGHRSSSKDTMMTKPIALTCAALALSFGLSLAPAAWAAEATDGSAKMSSGDAMMHKGTMKKHKKHKDGMMSSGDAMKKDEAAPAQ